MAATFVDKLVCNTINGQAYGESGDKYAPFYNLRVSLGLTISSLYSNTTTVFFGPTEPFELPTPGYILTPLDGAADIVIYDSNNSPIFSGYSFSYNNISKKMTIVYQRVPGMTYKVIYESASAQSTSGVFVQLDSTEAPRSLSNVILEPFPVPPTINCVSNSIIIGLDNTLAPPESAQTANPVYVPRTIKCKYNAEFNEFDLIKDQYDSMYGPYLLSHCLGLADTAPYTYPSAITVTFADGTVYGELAPSELIEISVTASTIPSSLFTKYTTSRALVDNDVLDFTLTMNKGNFVDDSGSAFINNIAVGQANTLIGSSALVIGNNNRSLDQSIILGDANESENSQTIVIGANNLTNYIKTVSVGYNLQTYDSGVNLGNSNTINTGYRNMPAFKDSPELETLFNALKNNFLPKTATSSTVVYEDQIYVYETLSIQSANKIQINNDFTTYYGYYIHTEGLNNSTSYMKNANYILWSILSITNDSLVYNESTILPANFAGEPIITTPGGYEIKQIDYANGLFYIYKAGSTTMPGELEIAYYRLKYENDIYQNSSAVIGYNNIIQQPNSIIIGNTNEIGRFATVMNEDPIIVSNNTVIGVNNNINNATQSVIIGADNTITNIDENGNEIDAATLNTSNTVIGSYFCRMNNCVNSTLIGCRSYALTNGLNTTSIGMYNSDIINPPPDCVILPGLFNNGKTIKKVITITTNGTTFKNYTDIFINTIEIDNTTPADIFNIVLETLDNTPGRVYNINLLLRAADTCTVVASSNSCLYIKNIDPTTGKAIVGSATHTKQTTPFTNVRDSFTLTCMAAGCWLLDWI